MNRFYLVRHGEPELRDVFLGRTDSPLSALGQIRAAEALSRLQAAIVYCSPLSRSFQTAMYIPCMRRVIVLDGLSEIDFGDWETKSWGQVEQGWPDVARMKRKAWLGVTPPGGESWTAFHGRVMKAWELIKQGPTPAVIVAHMAVNAVLAGHLFGIDPATFRQEYCEVLAVDR